MIRIAIIIGSTRPGRNGGTGDQRMAAQGESSSHLTLRECTIQIMNPADNAAAFGASGIEPRWTSSAKEGVGTAYHTKLWSLVHD